MLLTLSQTHRFALLVLTAGSEVTCALLASGATVSAVDASGNTPQMVAEGRGKTDVADILTATAQGKKWEDLLCW